MPIRSGDKLHRRRWVDASSIACLVVGLMCVASLLGPVVAYADAPAITDFGQTTVQPVMTAHPHSATSFSQAAFMTLYADGHGQVEIRGVHNDAMASFAGDHPAWKLDEGLKWFMQMPVYVKEISSQSSPYGGHVPV